MKILHVVLLTKGLDYHDFFKRMRSEEELLVEDEEFELEQQEMRLESEQ